MTAAHTAPHTVPDPHHPDAEPIDISYLPQPIPTDKHALIAYFIEHRPWPDHVGAALASEIGAERADRLITTVEYQVRHSDLVDEFRTNLRDELGHAEQALRAVRQTLDTLCGSEVYDVEYAEGGATTTAMREQLELAQRAVTIATGLNPFRRPEPARSRRLVLQDADVHPASKSGIVHAGPAVHPLALAELVIDGLGEFVRDNDSPEPVKPVTGVRLNEAGFAAALEAGAEVPF